MTTATRPETTADYTPIGPELPIDNETINIAIGMAEAARLHRQDTAERAERLERIADKATHPANPITLARMLQEATDNLDDAQEDHINAVAFLHRLLLLSDDTRFYNRGIDWFERAHDLYQLPYPPEFPTDILRWRQRPSRHRFTSPRHRR